MLSPLSRFLSLTVTIGRGPLFSPAAFRGVTGRAVRCPGRPVLLEALGHSPHRLLLS